MRAILLLSLSAAFLGAVGCGSVVALEGADPRSLDAGTAANDAASPTDAAPVDPTVCPTTPVTLPAGFTGASYTGGGWSVALGGGLLQPLVFTATGIDSVGKSKAAPDAAEIYALPGSSAFAVSEGFSDAATRSVRVFGEGFVERAALSVTNTNSVDLRREGISADNQIAYVSSSRGIPTVAIHSGDNACFNCEFVGVAGDSLYVIHDGALERRTLTTASPGTSVVARAVREPGREPPRLVGVAGRLVFFTQEDTAFVLDRETLAEAPFALESDELVRAVVERRDGTLDLFSVQSGEIAFASHRDSTGRMLARGEGYAAYGFANPTPCGFWVGGTHLPFER